MIVNFSFKRDVIQNAVYLSATAISRNSREMCEAETFLTWLAFQMSTLFLAWSWICRCLCFWRQGVSDTDVYPLWCSTWIRVSARKSLCCSYGKKVSDRWPDQKKKKKNEFMSIVCCCWFFFPNASESEITLGSFFMLRKLPGAECRWRWGGCSVTMHHFSLKITQNLWELCSVS